MGLGGRSILFLLLCLLLLSSVSAVSIGVNKARLSYVDVLQNGYAQEYVTISTDSPNTITGGYEVEGDIAPWIRFEPGNETFSFSRERPHTVKIIVEPPQDARLGDYSGSVRVITGEIARSEGGKIGQTTRAAFLIRLGLGITGTERLECDSGGIAIRNTEIGQPFEFVASVQNEGNVRIRPEFLINVYDQSQTLVMQEFSYTAEEDILPTTTESLLHRFTHGLRPGQYFAEVSVPLCADGASLTFDILDRGGIADKGELLLIEAPSWSATGDILPIDAVFQNQGSRVVEARFTGTITKEDDDRIYKVIDTAPVNVLPGETARLRTFFNPTEAAKYVVRGRVNYNNKLTFEKSAILNVNGPTFALIADWGGPIFLILLLIILILILLILIARKKRKSRHPSHRRILR